MKRTRCVPSRCASFRSNSSAEMQIASVLRFGPYTTAGTLPAARSRRAPPLRNWSRRSTVMSTVSMAIPSHEQRADRILVVGALDGLRQKRRHRAHADLAGVAGVRLQGDGVGHHDLFEYRRFDALHRLAGEDRMRDAGEHRG